MVIIHNNRLKNMNYFNNFMFVAPFTEKARMCNAHSGRFSIGSGGSHHPEKSKVSEIRDPQAPCRYPICRWKMQ